MGPHPNKAATLELFKTARDQVIEVLTEGRAIAHVFGPLQEQLEDDFQAAAKAVEASCLRLVVVGGEGTGKSTLINAITGSDVTPRSKLWPGTVAPILLEWGPEPDPVYSVVMAGSHGEVACADVAEFGTYLLQCHNEDNHKGVQRGYVRWNHPLLAPGLVVVEMPGVDSPSMRQQAEELINQAHAIIGIFRGKAYSPLIRLAHVFSAQDMAMQAIVSNWDSDVWHELGSQTPADAERFIAEIPKITMEVLDSIGGGIDVTEDRVYVLHLPSVSDSAAGITPLVTAPAHERERLRLEGDLWAHVEEYGIKEVILEAARRAEHALLEADVLSGTRERVLQAVLEFPEAASELAETFRQGQALAEGTWTTAYNLEVIEGVAHHHWATLAGAVEGVRNRVVDKIREIEAQVRAYEGKMRKPEARTVCDQLTDCIATEQAFLAETQEQLLGQVNDYYCAFAKAALDELYKAVPVIRESVPEEFTLSRKGLEDFVLKGLEDFVLKGLETSADGSRTVVKQWVLPGPPPVEALMGAIVGFNVVHVLREGARPGVLKALAAASQQLMAIDTSETGDLRADWGATVKGVADAVDAYLDERISRLEAMIADPGGSIEELEVQTARVDEARATVKDLQGRLITICRFSK